MTTIVEPLTRETHSFLEGFLTSYLDGACYYFAVAVHEGTGWPLVGITLRDGALRHVAVQPPGDTRLFDARGFVAREEFGEPFGFGRGITYELRAVSLQELRHKSEPADSHQHRVEKARELAEALWPELPWKESRQARIIAFLDAIEAVCREHQMWIRAPYATTWPHIRRADGAEAGYNVRRTEDGTGFTFEARFRL